VRQSLSILLSLICLLTIFQPAAANTNYMILEIRADGVASHEALDQSLDVDGTDPIIQHILLNRPANPETAQVLWVASDAPAQWVRGFDTNEFLFVEFTQLPPRSQIEYRIYDHESNVELGALRHHRNAADWGISYNAINRLQVGEYRIEARVIVPGLRMHRLIQRLNVVNYNGTNAPGQPIQEDNGEIGPVDNPNPGPGAGPDAPPSEPALVGFTPLTASNNTRIIYVSSSAGNDANDGLTPQTPVQTLNRGARLVRDGRPDWLLLKAGDVWNGQSFDGFTASGAGADRPMVIGVYGQGDRPLIIPPHNEHGLRTVNDEVNGLVIQGLHFYAATRDPGSPRYVNRDGAYDGINIRLGGREGRFADGLVIEDCVITHFDSNIKIVDDYNRAMSVPRGEPGRIQCVIRRNVIRYASGGDSHSVGIYIEGSRDSVIEQNLIDHNGWAQTDDFTHRNNRSHNIYAQVFNGPILVRENIITRAAATGMQLRAGGDVEGNIFVRNPMAFWLSINDSRVIDNVVLESDDINPDEVRDFRGMGLQSWSLGRCEIVGNVFARRVGGMTRPAIDVSADTLIIHNNRVYDWATPEGVGILASGGTLDMRGNFSRELSGGEEPSYEDPTRSLERYAGTIGLEPSLEAFLDALATRPRGQWDTVLAPETISQYIRDGFRVTQ